MSNPLIQIETVEDLQTELAKPNHVFLLILGNSATHQQAVGLALQLSNQFDFTLQAANPSQELFQFLNGLEMCPHANLTHIDLPHPAVIAVSISMNNKVAHYLKSAKPNPVAIAFSKADTCA